MADEIDVAVDVPLVNGTEDSLSTTVSAVGKLLQDTKRDRTVEGDAGFPYFDPDRSRVDVDKWCSDIDIRAERDNMRGFDIIPRVRAVLMDGAGEWCEGGAGIVGQMRAVLNVESNEFDTCTDFVMERTSQINRLPFEVPVQVLIDNLSTIRERPYKRIDQTHRFANDEYPIPPYAEHYRRGGDIRSCPSKRPRLSDDRRCFACGKVGHIRATCPENLFKNKQTPLILDKQKEANRKTNECTFCGGEGRDEGTCWAKQRAERRKVNICKNNDLPENRAPVIIQD